MLENNIKYIMNYIEKNYFCVFELKDSNYKEILARKIAQQMPNVDYSLGQYDFFIDRFINREMINKSSVSYERLTNVKNHVFLVMNYYNTFNGVKIPDFKKSQLLITKILISRYNYDDIINGKYDDLIKEYIYLNSGKKEESGVKEVVHDYMKQNGTYIEEDIDSVIELSKELIDAGYSASQIKSGACDPLIELYTIKDSVKKNSVESKNSSINRIPLKTKDTSKSLRTRALTLAVTVTLLGGAFVIRNTTEKINERPSISYVLDDYEYPSIPNEHSEEFAGTCMHVIYKYVDYAKYGEEYGQLCLFNAYKSIDSEPFHGMDVIFNVEKESAKTNENLELINDDIGNTSCYLVYVYNKLVNAGIEEINRKEYRDAVIRYDKQVANYKELNPFYVLDKSDQKLLEELMKIYEKYCDSLEIELEKKLEETRGAK